MTKKTKEQLNILLLQIREDVETIDEEIDNFAKFGKLHRSQIIPLNAFQRPDFTLEELPPFDALFVGGSSDASVLEPERFPFVLACQGLIRHCYDKGIPTFASCFGFQLAVVELGGEVILDKENMEMGIISVTLTDKAIDDPLLKGLPETFYAVSGHKERASRLPRECVNLGQSERCPFHLFTIENKPFYGFQFHPEVDKHTLRTRLTRYAHHYVEDEETVRAILQEARQETPISNQLVERFINHIVLYPE
jgi:GMP synthase (glutamine-hydrolysing)